jgi:hypothetical protein
MKTSILLAGAAVVALAAGPNAAQAASPTPVYSGGSTLAAKVYRDIFNCYVAAATTNPTTASNGVFVSSASASSYPAGASIQYPTALPAGCTKGDAANAVVLYEPVGSGAGQGAWQAANPAGNSTLGYKSWGTPATSNTIAYLDAASTVNQTTTPYPQIQFSGSDAFLNNTQIANACVSYGGSSNAPAATGQNCATNPVFQLPIFATPITLPVGNPNNVAKFNGVKLTTADVCNIFSGKSNHSAAGVTFTEVVVRNDGSGTSFIFADWLGQNCPASLSFNAANGFGAVNTATGAPGASTTPNWTAVFNANGNALPLIDNSSTSGSGGVAAVVGATQGAIGYLSPDYDSTTIPGSTAVSALVNGQAPSTTATKNHLTHASYPSSYNVYTIGQQLNDSLVAPGNTAGYPIVGYTFWETYSCYSATLAGGNGTSSPIGGPAAGKQVLALANYLYSTTNKSVGNILSSQGFVQAGTAVTNLLKGAGGPLNATGGIQNSACPSS